MENRDDPRRSRPKVKPTPAILAWDRNERMPWPDDYFDQEPAHQRTPLAGCDVLGNDGNRRTMVARARS